MYLVKTQRNITLFKEIYMKTNLLTKALMISVLTLCSLTTQASEQIDILEDLQGYYKLIPGKRFPVKEVAAFSRCNQVEGVMAVYISESNDRKHSNIVMKNNFSYLGYPFVEGEFTKTEQHDVVPMKNYVSQGRKIVDDDGIRELDGPTQVITFDKSESKVEYREKLVRGIIGITTKATSMELYGVNNSKLQVSNYGGFGDWDTCNYQRISEYEYLKILAAKK